jgi:hypothetical protein
MTPTRCGLTRIQWLFDVAYVARSVDHGWIDSREVARRGVGPAIGFTDPDGGDNPRHR